MEELEVEEGQEEKEEKEEKEEEEEDEEAGPCIHILISDVLVLHFSTWWFHVLLYVFLFGLSENRVPHSIHWLIII